MQYNSVFRQLAVVEGQIVSKQGNGSNQAQIRQAAQAVSTVRRVVALTGAGISAESGVPTFRSDNSELWGDLTGEQLASAEGFNANPQKVWKWYNQRRGQLGKIEPNPGHYALCHLADLCKDFVLITQNVDGLHGQVKCSKCPYGRCSKDGATSAVELHGNIWQLKCTKCQYQHMGQGQELPAEPRCPECGEWLRPAVVWFGEPLPADDFQAGVEACECCQVLLSIGTSALVQPAASLIWQAQACGAKIIEINPVPTPASQIANIRLVGPAGKMLPALVDQIKAINGHLSS